MPKRDNLIVGMIIPLLDPAARTAAGARVFGEPGHALVIGVSGTHRKET